MGVTGVLVTLTLFLGLWGQGHGASKYLQKVLINPSPNETFTRLVRDQQDGKLYMAAVNNLYRISPDLDIEESLRIGPQMDSPTCVYRGSGVRGSGLCNDWQMMNAYNKALLIMYRVNTDEKRLIVCSTLFLGSCQKRHLDNLGQIDLTDPSQDVSITPVPVVTNTQNATTVAFIAPGPKLDKSSLPLNNGNPVDTLYVGTSFGYLQNLQNVPAFSSRNLNTFKLTYQEVLKSAKETNSQYQSSFPIYYIYGFSSENYSYVLTVQKNDTSSSYFKSKLIRVCHSDLYFYSYVEVELQCNTDGARYPLAQAAHKGKAGDLMQTTLGINQYDDVLYVVFARGEPTNPSTDTALCMYPLTKIKKKFTENVQECFKGVGKTGPGHIVSKQVDCTASPYLKNIDDHYCGAYEINTPIDGILPITATASLVLYDAPVSAITVTTTHRYTVAFLGTRNGQLIKVALEPEAEAYERIMVEAGSKIHENMFFDDSQMYIYVFTDQKIYKLSVQDCEQYKTCATCRGARDPYCGWCSLEDRCSLRVDCQDYDQDLRWMEYSGQACTNITYVWPDKIQKDHKQSMPTTLTLNISNLPMFTGTYKCAFSKESLRVETDANRTSSNIINCNVPRTEQLPVFPTNADHIVMKLAVLMNGKEFVSTNFTIFDCEVYSNDACYTCTQSLFNCTWCIRNHMCTHYPLNDCSKDDTFIGNGNPANGGLTVPHTRGSTKCPYFAGMQHIVVPSGTMKTITVPGHNIMDFQDPLHCVFRLTEEKTVPAKRISIQSDVISIECQDFRFEYPDNVPFKKVPFRIVWGGQSLYKPLDNPTHLQVEMFKCQYMAGSCGQCLIQEQEYDCGWCNNKDVCSIQRNCNVTDQWLSRSKTCPSPEILNITPLTGPMRGGTKLTIHGKDLGKSFDDIVANVDVIGIQCTPIRDDYKPATVIVCITGAFNEKQHRQNQGQVRVTVASTYIASSKSFFTYVNPEISGFTPSSGPVAGGTQVVIRGIHMDAGTNIMANIGGYPCVMESKSQSKFVCTTSAANATTKNAGVYMIFDQQNVSSSATYEYLPNPTIDFVSPLKAIQSGGISITAQGDRLYSILKPKMILWHDGEAFESNCTRLDAQTLHCTSPQIDKSLLAGYDSGREFYYGFRLDGVKETQNLTSLDPKFGMFTIYPDPVLEKFPEDLKIFTTKNNDYLTISGLGLRAGIDNDSEFRVKIGDSFCNVTSVDQQILCTPPKTQPSSVEGHQYPEVYVLIGENLSVYVGQLKYEENQALLPTEYAIVIGIVGVILVLLVILLIFLYCAKSRKNTNMVKRLQIQMDTLEAKVAKECKEAFAELQTDMNDMTNNTYGNQIALPFWNYQTYCMRVLFPTHDVDVDHPVMRDLEVEYSRRESVEKGLKLFNSMLNNKTFILIFVRTLEANPKFTMRDRVNVASLLSVALQTKMEYATDILKTLLADLIEKKVESNQPKLLLRRTETVAEKMLTNWFTFLLYKFLRECAGEPLFMLYQAVKQQVAKGPVDACNDEARYSLSEDKLIRQQLDYKQMTIHVQEFDRCAGQPAHAVRVLDCDTISQVKEKILDAMYKSAPYSSRYTKDSVELVLNDYCPPANSTEWSSGIQGTLLLQDDDATTKVEGEYKKLNTLAHYKVPDGAYMQLRHKPFSNSLTSDTKLMPKYFTDYTRSPSLNRNISPQGIHVEMEGNLKYYHLVKPNDSESLKEGDRGNKMVSEIYLTRLLSTKGTLQTYVDNLFESIFSASHRVTALPLAIKYMFDFLDDQALHHCIQDPEVVHIWKCNGLPLRFWVNVIKNPDFVFDIYKSPIVDACLSVVGQTFMDSCSVSQTPLGPDSPSNKLLYAKDIPNYKRWVEKYHTEIKMMPAISDQDMTAMMTEESRLHQDEFNTSAALYELYKYVQKYNEELWQALDEDEFAKKNKLTYKLEQVRMTMEAEVYC